MSGFTVLSILVDRGDVHPRDLLAVSMTCRYMRTWAWRGLVKRYADGQSLEFDARAPKRTRDGISKTEAMKTYKLNHEDVSKLGTHAALENYIVSYHVNASYYRPCDVYWLACAKHGGPHGIRDRLNSKSKARQSREAALASMGSLTPYEMNIAAEYLKNGKGGIRALKATLDRYRAFESRSECPCDALDLYVDGAMSLEDAQALVDRRRALITALNRLRLPLRTDSRLCDAYIYQGIGDAVDIADTLLEMKFLHEHTTYPKLMREMMDKDRDARDWPWLPREEYLSALADRRIEISIRARALVMQRPKIQKLWDSFYTRMTRH